MDEISNSLLKINGALKHNISPKKNHLISVFQSLELTLTDKKKKYFDKVQSLLTAWEQIVVFVSETSTESPQPAFEFLFVNTLRFVLRADWPRSSVATKTHLTVTLQRFVSVLARSENYHSILGQCRILESVVQNPWGHPVLCKILNSQEVDLNESAEYFNFENGKVIVIRLEMMLQSKCEDIAVHLSKSCLHTYNRYNENLEGFDILDFTQDEIDYITDIYFSSLLKTKKKSELITEIKNYQLDDGLRLLQRYKTYGVGGKYNEHCKGARVWKCNKKLIELLSNTLLANAVLHENLIESQSQLEELILEWASVHTTNVNNVVPPLALEMIRKFVLIAPSSKCIYPFCSFLINNGCKEQDINQVARCLIRAVNQNMNEIEQYRVNQEREKLKETYDQLSKGFVLISELFSDHSNILKECLLTSFSLTPSRERLQKIEDYVNKLANAVETEIKTETTCEPDEVVKSEPSKEPEPPPPPIELKIKEETTDLNEIFESMGLVKDEVYEKEIEPAIIPKQTDFKKGSAAPAYMTEVENLKLDDNMQVDLNCILRYQRYHTLTWDLEWDQLKVNCEQYLENFEKKGFDDVELKYLDLDYNQFKDQPINYEEFCGIEKGYEQYAYSAEETEEERLSAKGSEFSSGDSDEDFSLTKKKKKTGFDGDRSKRKYKKKNKIERTRKNSKRKDDIGISEDEILRTISKQKSNPVSLKALREFRIKTNPLSNGIFDDNHNESNEEKLKEAEMLNEILADSFKSLECVEIPPMSPRFNVYDVMLEETLLPSNSEVRLPKCDNLVVNNETIFNKDICQPKPPKTEKKRKFFVTKERIPTLASKKKNLVNHKSADSSKSIAKKEKLSNGLNTYLNGSAEYSSLLGREDMFKRSFNHNKFKNGDLLISNLIRNKTEKAGNMFPIKECMVQLPKLNENLSQSVPRKESTNQNMNFYNSTTSTKRPENVTRNIHDLPSSATPIDDKLCDSLGDVNLDNIVNLLGIDCMNANALNETIDCNTIENLVTLTNSKPEQNQIESAPEPDAAAINELNQTLFDFINEQFPAYPTNQMYGTCVQNQKPVMTSAPATVIKQLPTSSKLVPINAATTTNLYEPVPKPKRQYHKKSDTKVVNKILGEYQAMINKYPQLQNIPAPRKRNAKPANAVKRQRTKKSAQVINVNDAINKNSYLANGETSSINGSNSFPSGSTKSAAITQSTPVFIPEKNLCFPNNSTIVYKANKPKLPNSAVSTDSSPIYSKPKIAEKRDNLVAFERSNPANKNTELCKVLQGTYLQNSSIQNSNQYSNQNKLMQVQSSLVKVTNSNYNANPTYVPSKFVPSGTLKSLLTRGTNYNNVQMPVVTLPSTAPPKTYGTGRQIQNCQKVSVAQTLTTNVSSNYAANRQVPTNVNNMGVNLINKQRNPNVNVNMVNEQNVGQIPLSSAGLVKTFNSYVNANVSTPTTTLVKSAYNAAAPVSNNNVTVMNNLEVRIPRIDLKVNPASNFYEQPKYTTSTVNTNAMNSVQYSYLNASKSVNQNSVPMENNSTYVSPVVLSTATTVEEKHDMKIPFLYATISNANAGTAGTEVSNSAEVCISIPETAYSEAYYGNYLTLIQSE